MKRIERLKREGLESAIERGHKMNRFQTLSHKLGYVVAVSHCRTCDMQLAIDESPPPNGIDIGGEAVALDCGSESRWQDGKLKLREDISAGWRVRACA